MVRYLNKNAENLQELQAADSLTARKQKAGHLHLLAADQSCSTAP